MFLFEVFVPADMTTPRRRAEIAERLGTALVTEDIAAVETVQSTQELTDVLVHEVPTWHVGGRSAAGGAPRYLVRASVPGPWRKEMSEHIVTRVTAVLTEVTDGDLDVRVQVVGVPEGGHGLSGRVYGSTELAELLSEPYRKSRREGTAQTAPDGAYVDPSCGAVIPHDTNEAVVAEVDGVTYGFCCSGCRDAYLKEVAGSPSH